VIGSFASVTKRASGFRLQASGRKQKTAKRGFGLREGFKEKWKGDSPSPLIPFDRLTTPLSLGGARKTKEKGYDGP
jgi:hypothetical protein